MKLFDVVKTPGGGIAIITETDGSQASIDYITNPHHEHNAWWDKNRLKVLANVIEIIGNSMAHPFGVNGKQGTKFIGKKVRS